MPRATLGDQRWKHSGENSGGDLMYSRHVTGVLGDYESWTKDELSEELERRDLPKSGSKAELVARLFEDDGS